MTRHPMNALTDAGAPVGSSAQPPTSRSPVRGVGGTSDGHGTPVPPQGAVAENRAEGEGAGKSATPSARTWVIELPAGLKMLSLNDRLHWAEKNRRSRDIKMAAFAMARNTHVPHLDRASIIVEYQPPDRRHRDNDNVPAASGKHAIDGVVQAGVLLDDEAGEYVAGIQYRIGPVHPKGRLVLHITEVTS